MPAAKKLSEVALPLDAINQASARDYIGLIAVGTATMGSSARH